jgi:probable HAF family extracellular repeat protein
VQELPNLTGASSASANGINNLGEVVGGSGTDAVLWKNDRDRTPVDLGVLPGLGWSSAFAINDFDEVVGWSGFAAFLWTPAGGMQDLNALIDSNSGWQLTSANAINHLGQITGEGTINGQTHAFLLTPTSP